MNDSTTQPFSKKNYDAIRTEPHYKYWLVEKSYTVPRSGVSRTLEMFQEGFSNRKYNQTLYVVWVEWTPISEAFTGNISWTYKLLW